MAKKSKASAVLAAASSTEPDTAGPPDSVAANAAATEIAAVSPPDPPLLATVELAAPLPPVSLPPQAAGAECLVVTSKGPRRRRAGRAFTPAETVIPLAELSEDERAAIEGDSELQVLVRGETPVGS